MPDPRSYLYVPGDRADFLARSLQRGADALLVDLEDAVPPDRKDVARAVVRDWLAGLAEDGAASPAPQVWIRLNPGPAGLDDLAAVGSFSRVAGYCVAKADAPADVSRIASALDDLGSAARLMPLIESAAAVLACAEIARAPRVERLQIGEADLAADTGVDPDAYGEQFAVARSLTVYASAAAGIGAPVAPVSTDFRDLDRFADSTARLRRLGFFGRACIHPAQVPAANEAFTTDPEAAERARQLLEHQERLGESTFVGPDGRLVDEAVLRSARRTVAQAFR